VPGTAVTFTANYSGVGATPDFQWLRNGKVIPFETAPVYTSSSLKTNDTISVRLTAHDPCPANAVVTSNLIRVSNASVAGVDHASGEGRAQITLYPNPNNGQFTINADLGTERIGEHATLELLNMMGQVIYKTELQIASAHTTTEVSLGDRVAKGMYQVRLRANGVAASSTLVIQ
jgi:hypothetical protein